MASLEIVDYLVAAGFTDKQSRAMAQAIDMAAQKQRAELATKADLYAVKADLHRTILHAVYALGGMMVTVAIAAVTIAVMVLR